MLILPGVYEPREDTQLLLSALPRDLSGLRCLDMGTGSGIVGIEMAKRGGIVTFVDAAPTALLNARINARLLGVRGTFLLSDLFENVHGVFDLITFNPPYLPKEELNDLAIEGGSDLIERFFDELPDHLVPNGRALVVISSLDPPRIPDFLQAREIVKMHIFFEDIVVLEVKHAA